MYTMQEVFDKACTAIIAQGMRSSEDFDNEYSGCLYRGPNGLKCAIGHLLSDEQIEFFGVKEGNSPLDFHPDLLDQLIKSVDTSIFTCKSDFLNEIQNLHDTCLNSEGDNFVFEFKAIAKQFAEHAKLNYNF